MEYQITEPMALELVRLYLERIYTLNKHKGIEKKTLEYFFDLNLDLKKLVDQMRVHMPDIDSHIEKIRTELNIKFVYQKLDIHIDGATRRNETKEEGFSSAIAYHIHADGELLQKYREYIGTEITLPRLRNEPFGIAVPRCSATNNVAEYYALLRVMTDLFRSGLTASHIEIFSDSENMVSQVNKTHSTRAEHLIRLRNAIWELIPEFDNITITHIPREQNTAVDDYLREFMDEYLGLRSKQEDKGE